MQHLKRFLFFIGLVFSLNITTVAQDKVPIRDTDYDNRGVEMADRLRADGKIYVLLGIILVIFAGFTVYMVKLEKKIGKLEKEIKESGH